MNINESAKQMNKEKINKRESKNKGKQNRPANISIGIIIKKYIYQKKERQKEEDYTYSQVT